MAEFWLRYIEVKIGSLSFNSDNFDIEFEVEKKESEAKTAIITIYNISQQTREQIKADDIVELKAGYKTDYGTIFYGKVANVDVEVRRGDEAMIIECVDSTADLNKNPIVVNYPAGTDAAQVVRDICSYCSIPIGKIENTGIIFERPYTPEPGTPKEIIDEVVKYINGRLRAIQQEWSPRMILSSPDFGQEYIFTIENNMAYLVKGSKLVYEAEVIEAETGLLEVNKVKDEDKDKFRIKTLLRWRIQVGRPVVINSSKLSGQFDVFACKHLCKNKSYYTEFEVVP